MQQANGGNNCLLWGTENVENLYKTVATAVQSRKGNSTIAP